MGAVRRALPLLVGLAVVLALAAGLALGRATASGVERIDDAVSVGFAHDMAAHHAQAVAMSEVVHRRSTDPALQYLAFDILSTQQGQIGILSGWLAMSDQPQSGGGERMAWMGHAGPMPGMATPEELRQLEDLPVPAMEEQFLRLMVRHHRGAVPMADVAAEQAGHPRIAELARKMSTGQQSEIGAMQDMLRRRGVPPEPEEGATIAGASPAAVPTPSGHGQH